MNGVVRSMSPHPLGGPVPHVSLLLILTIALAGCLGGDEGTNVEDRLMSGERAAENGLHHCVVDEDMQQETGIMSNPGEVPAALFAGADEGGQIEEFWLQLLGPEEGIGCDEVPDEDLIIVSAMAFASPQSMDDAMAEDAMCAQITGNLLVGEVHAVATEGDSHNVEDVADVLAAENPDLSDPCS